MSEKEKQYQKMFEQYLSHVEDTHERNRQKIKTGLKINLILPWLFLIISYVTDRSKLFFLILWILSLFGIAFYLVYIEYTDYHMQKFLGEMDDVVETEDNSDSEVVIQALTGRVSENIEQKVNERMDILDQKIDNIDSRIEQIILASARRLAAKDDFSDIKESGEEADDA